MKQINVTINDSTLRSAQMIADRRNKTIDEVISEMLEHGIKDTCYRMNRNAQKWQETKELKATVSRLERMLQEKGE